MSQINRPLSNGSKMIAPLTEKNISIDNVIKSRAISHPHILIGDSTEVSNEGNCDTDSCYGSYTIKAAVNKQTDRYIGHHNPNILIEKLSQRLAFERSGVRLYDALICKCQTFMDDVTAEIVSVDLLCQFRDEEQEHALLLETVMEELGVNRIVMSPVAIESPLITTSLLATMKESRTSILQCLEAIQMAEFADNAAWSNLQMLCLLLKLDDIPARFSKPVSQERVHEEIISDWTRQLILYRPNYES